MACDRDRVFVLGGELSPDAQVEEAKPIHILDTSMFFLFVIIRTAPKFGNTELLIYPEPNFDAVNPSEKAAQIVQKSLGSPLTRGQPRQPSSSSRAHAAHDASSFQKLPQKN